MNAIKSLIIPSTLVLALAGCGGEKAESNGDSLRAASAANLSQSTARLIVYGMGCPLCATNVEKGLMGVGGVLGVAIDLGDGSVTVSVSDERRPTKAALTEAVEEGGFTVADATLDYDEGSSMEGDQ